MDAELVEEFRRAGILEESVFSRGDTKELLRTAKQRLRAYLQPLTVDELVDRLWRQDSHVNEVRLTAARTAFREKHARLAKRAADKAA
jgi:hypothetical protein